MRSLLPLLLFALPTAATDDNPPPPVPAPASAQVPVVTGEALLAEVVGHLEAGDFGAAVQLAVPAISAFPALAPSFRAAADLAMDQLHRQQPAPIIINQGSVAGFTSEPAEWKVGFDVGTMTGLRVEWDRNGRVIDSMGFRVGGGLMVYSSVIPTGHAAYYIDWRLSERLRLETPIGLLLYGGSPYPLIQLGLQVEIPERSMHVNAGIGYLSGFLPDIGVGFLW
jgi:hypothetical protein